MFDGTHVSRIGFVRAGFREATAARAIDRIGDSLRNLAVDAALRDAHLVRGSLMKSDRNDAAGCLLCGRAPGWRV